VPWDQALDTILRTKRLHAERDGNLLRIVTNAEFVQEANEQLRAREPASR
jgi:type II secretory pathway component HofQ